MPSAFILGQSRAGGIAKESLSLEARARNCLQSRVFGNFPQLAGQGLSEGTIRELASHGFDARDLIGAAIRKGIKGEALYQIGKVVGVPPSAMKWINLGAAL